MTYQCIRTYRFNRGALGSVKDSAMRDLLPDLERQPGFLGFRLITTADDRAVSESIWETYEQAQFADVVEAAWVRQTISDRLDGLPDLFVGPIEVFVQI